MEVVFMFADLLDDPDDGEREEAPQEPPERVRPPPRSDRWAWLREEPDEAHRAA